VPERYVTLPIQTDPEDLAELAFDTLRAAIPGWEPSDAQFDTVLLRAFAQIAAEIRDVASDVPAAVFRAFGASLMNLPPQEATRAVGATTWTAIDTAGYTIPAGTLIGIPAAGDDLVIFEVDQEVTISPGQSATSAGAVPIVAVDAGASGSGLLATPVLVDALDWINTIALTSTTTGGVDAEEDTDYLDRLAEQLQLPRRPVIPADFEILARSVTGVQRAIAIDGYNPGDLSSNNERMIALAVHDAVGAACSAGVKNTLDAAIEAAREVNFVVNVIDPTSNVIDVTFTAVAFPGYDVAQVEADADAAVAAFLNPATWGSAPDRERAWLPEKKVRYLELAAALNAVPGLDYLSTLTFRKSGDSHGTSDVTMTGVAPLPAAGTITSTVTAP
jgi:uncharacterized phage protein gp47/JayE